MSKPIVVAVDGSDAGRRAVVHAAELASGSGAALVVAHVLEWSPYSFLTQEELARADSALVAPVVNEIKAKGITVTAELRYGHVAETLATSPRRTAPARS